jgi:uncharacterized protein YggE
MYPRPLLLIALSFWMSAVVPRAGAQQPSGIKFLADTLIIQADGRDEADRDLATLSFDISAQDKDLKTAYDRASQSVQKILALAQKNGVAQSDISSRVLSIRPFYEGDRKKRARSFLVQGQLTLKVRDFARLEPILENSVDDGIVDFRSLTYSLSDEEAAKQKAVAEAVQHSWDCGNAASKPRGQKAGALRFVNVDVNQLTGGSEIELSAASPGKIGVRLRRRFHERQRQSLITASTAPIHQAKKITVSATVECAYQILIGTFAFVR